MLIDIIEPEGLLTQTNIQSTAFTRIELIKALQKSKSVKYRRSIGYSTITAKLSGIKVNLFFYRKGKNGN